MKEYTRRAVLGGAAAGLATTTGCLGFVTGDEPLAFDADPASVSRAKLAETDYEESARRSPTVTREFTVAGQTREVSVTNRLALYEKAADLGPLGERKVALFALVATPQVELAGRTFNPVGDMSMRELLEQFQSRYDGLAVDERVGSATVSTLDTEVTVERYAGTTTVKGQTVELYLHVARFEHRDDFVVATGAYPRRMSDEADTIHSLISHVEH